MAEEWQRKNGKRMDEFEVSSTPPFNWAFWALNQRIKGRKKDEKNGRNASLGFGAQMGREIDRQNAAEVRWSAADVATCNLEMFAVSAAAVSLLDSRLNCMLIGKLF
jgi:hypothetical protein